MVDGVCFEFGEYRLNVASRELWRGSERIDLPYRVFDCLAYLVEHRDRAVGRDELVAAVWGRVDISDAQLGQIVLRVRRAVGDDGNAQQTVRTMPKFGYRWVAPTQVVPLAAAEPAPPAAPFRFEHERDEGDPAPAAISWTPTPARPLATPWPVPLLALGLAFIAVLAVLLIDGHGGAGEPVGARDTLVLPIRIDAGDEHDWVRLGAMDLVASRLRAGGLAVPSAENILIRLQSAPAVASAGGDDVDLDALRRALSAQMLVSGRLQASDEGWRMQIEVSRADAPALRVQADAADLLAAARRGSDRLLIELGRKPPAITESDVGLEETLQRAQAAMLANQLDVARAILAGAPALQRAKPQLRYFMAQVDMRAGRFPDVRSAMAQLLEDPSLPLDARLHGAVLNTLASANYNLDDAETAERYYDAAATVLLDAGDPLELGRAYGGRGAAKGAQLRFDEALDDFGLARVQLGQAGDRLIMARVDQVMASLEMRRPRMAQARALLERATAELEAMGAVNELLYGLALLARVELAELNYAAAQAASDRAWALRERATDPESRHVMAINRAEIELSLGRHAQAGALLAGLAQEAEPANPWSLGVADWLRARVAFAEGDPAGALAFADAARQRITSPEYDDTATRLALLRQRALIELGRVDEAAQALAEFEATRGELAQTRPLVELAVARAELAQAQGRADDAAELFRQAMDGAEARAVPDELVLAGEAYAGHLLANRRVEDASAVVGRLAPWSGRDYRAALLQVRLYHALGQEEAWSRALRQASGLAGERDVPAALQQRPPRLRLSAGPS